MFKNVFFVVTINTSNEKVPIFCSTLNTMKNVEEICTNRDLCTMIDTAISYPILESG